MNEIVRKIGESFKKADSIWLASHIRPDGDAIGSIAWPRIGPREFR